MSIHLITICEEPDGMEIIDLIWCCSQGCMFEELAKFDLVSEPEELADIINLKSGGSVSYGAFPCGEESDSDTYCGHCEELISRGLEYYRDKEQAESELDSIIDSLESVDFLTDKQSTAIVAALQSKFGRKYPD